MTNPADLPNDIDVLKAIVLRQQDQNARLEKLVADFKRALFGAKSEKADPEQYELAFEDIETAIETIHAERDADVVLRQDKPRKSNRGHLPKHLPRIEEVIEPEDATCTCGAERHIIGEDTSERLDIIPAQFRVIHCPAVHVYMHERGHPSPKICLSILRSGYCAGSGQTPSDRGRYANRSNRGQRDSF